MPSMRACAGNPPLIGLPSGAPGGSRKRCITWLEAQLPRLAVSSTLAGAIRYARSRWEGLKRFRHDGRITAIKVST
jgi:hypothetical protein